jgi:sulfur-oxidizing protein SoxY
MERRKFLSFGLAALALPLTANAIDWRSEKPNAWLATNPAQKSEVTGLGRIQSGLDALYGTGVQYVESDNIKIKIPSVASNGGSVPVSVESSIPAKTVALFQDANPESLVAVWDVIPGQPIDYYLNIKMKFSGFMAVVVTGTDGKHYIHSQSLEVALGGCEG